MIVACIPCYNEEQNIAKVIIETKKFVDQVIVCDDGSNDFSVAYDIASAPLSLT